MTDHGENGSETPDLPSLWQAARIWFRIGCLSFGGPAGQIALMHRELVETRRWVGDRSFLQALNFCSLLPGPEAQQLATYVGWLMHGAIGGWIAGLLFILPGAVIIMGLCLLYVTTGEAPIVTGLFLGLTAAVLVIVFDALRRVARRALAGPLAWGLAVGAFVALFLFGVPFPLVVIAAGLMGLLLPAAFRPPNHGEATATGDNAVARAYRTDPHLTGSRRRSARRASLLAFLAWGGGAAGLALAGGLFADIALLFSKLAVVTFGGAYAVLSYVAQEAVTGYGWLTAEQMLVGLGLAESTPGPLILVLQFVGFFAGFGADGRIVTAIAGAVATLWITFTPCFAFVFLGAPMVEAMGRKPRLSGALSAITAAVVGVIANLALWFSLQVLFDDARVLDLGPLSVPWPNLATVDAAALGLALLAALLFFTVKRGTVVTLGLCAGAGAILALLGG